MNSLIRSACIVVIAAYLLFVATPVSAQTTLSQEQRDRISANCLTIKNTLTQLRASDALLRVNRGQVYEALGTRLMDRFNARLGSNGLDARGLTSLTKSYDERLAQFRIHYDEYARQLETALRIDCSNDPDAFHLAITNARTKRAIVHEDVLRLHTLIDDYRSSVNDFRLNFERVSDN
jgi:hypothetical protein